MMRDFELLWRDAGQFRAEELAAVIREHRRNVGGCTPAGSARADRRKQVGQMAMQAGMSREGFPVCLPGITACRPTLSGAWAG